MATARLTELLWVSAALTMALGQTALADGPGGACCLADACVAVDEGTCNAMGGFFLPGEDCANDPCGVGACCTETACVEADAYTCLLGGRNFAGAGTSCDESDPCGIGMGACCLDGACTFETMQDCESAGGLFAGIGVVCGIEPCAAGACCVGTDCFDELRFQCNDRGGTFLPGAACVDDPCADPKACPSGSLFGQSRDGPTGNFTAGTSEFGSGFARSEDFSGVAGPIEGLVWYGLDLEYIGGNEFIECIEEDTTFLVTFYRDAGGRPGEVVCTDKVTATRKPLGIFYGGFAELNEYSATLSAPCTLVNGWISIVGLGAPDCWFLWMSAGIGYSWCDGCSPPEQGFDLSLCLLGTPGGVFGACCDDDTGVCADDVEITACLGANQRFRPGQSCDELDPPCGVIEGACCLGDATCSIVTEAACGALGGSWLGANTLCSACPCVAVCPAGSRIEGEPRCEDGYVDLFNGGCYSATPMFTPIELGDVVCGESGLFLRSGETTPDFDVYELTLEKAMLITWDVIAEFPPLLRIVNGTEGCPGTTILSAAAETCDPAGIAAFLQPGTYWLVVFPAGFVDEAACGAHYTAVLGPDPCPEDLDGSGAVDFADILRVLSAWGPCPPQFCREDLNQNGVVDFGDLLLILGAWGPCG